MNDITNKVFKFNALDFNHPAFVAVWDKDYSIVKIEDTSYKLSDLEGDCFDPEVNPEIPVRKLIDERRAFRSRVAIERVWGIGLARNGAPIYETFVWGYVGDDYLGSGHDRELIDQLAAALLKP